MFSPIKQVCADCHFFFKEARDLPTGRSPREITEEERKKAHAGDYSWHKEYYALSCKFGVWDEGHNFDHSKKHALLTQTDRRRFCFFWKHRPGMLLPAAEILQQREAKAYEARVDRKLTICGLWIAAISLLVNTFLRISERFSSWPF